MCESTSPNLVTILKKIDVPTLNGGHDHSLGPRSKAISAFALPHPKFLIAQMYGLRVSVNGLDLVVHSYPYRSITPKACEYPLELLGLLCESFLGAPPRC